MFAILKQIYSDWAKDMRGGGVQSKAALLTVPFYLDV